MSSKSKLAPKIAVFPGSFDPLTRGHTDLVNRSAAVFERVIVAVLLNPAKSTLFSIDERVEFIKKEFSGSSSIQVKSFSGLLVDFAKREGAQVIIRGLRAISDYDYEAQMALMNKSLCEELETMFMISREEYSYVSSTLVKQIASLGGSVSKIVTPLVEAELKRKFSMYQRVSPQKAFERKKNRK